MQTLTVYSRARTTKLCTPLPTNPPSSNNIDSAIPHPFPTNCVVASTQIHSPSGGRSRWIVKSELMKL